MSLTRYRLRSYSGRRTLDVFNEEPLPSEHPYWTHPKVKVWPHVSAQSNADSAARQVADAIGKVFSGAVPNNLVSREQQY